MTAGKKKPNKDRQEGKNSPEQLYSGYVDLFSLFVCVVGWEEVWNIYNDIIAVGDTHTHTHWCSKFFTQPKLVIVLTQICRDWGSERD